MKPMTYGELHKALGDALKTRPEAKDQTAYIAAIKPGSQQGYYDTDAVAVEVRVDKIGLIVLTEGDQ